MTLACYTLRGSPDLIACERSLAHIGPQAVSTAGDAPVSAPKRFADLANSIFGGARPFFFAGSSLSNTRFESQSPIQLPKPGRQLRQSGIRCDLCPIRFFPSDLRPFPGGSCSRLGGTAFRLGGIHFHVGRNAFRVGGIHFRVGGIGFRVGGNAFRVGGNAFRVGEIGFRVGGNGFRVGEKGFLQVVVLSSHGRNQCRKSFRFTT